MRRLTNRQVAVLAAIERMGNPTMPELQFQLPNLAVGEIFRVIEALELRGLVAESGSPPRFAAVPRDHHAGRLGSVPAGE